MNRPVLSNKVLVGDHGNDGRIYPVSAAPERKDKNTGHLDFMDEWYPVQVKQKDKTGRPTNIVSSVGQWPSFNLDL